MMSLGLILCCQCNIYMLSKYILTIVKLKVQTNNNLSRLIEVYI